MNTQNSTPVGENPVHVFTPTRLDTQDKKTLDTNAEKLLPANIKVHTKIITILADVPRFTIKTLVFDAKYVENSAYRSKFTLQENMYLWYKTEKQNLIAYELERLKQKCFPVRDISVVVDTVGWFPAVAQIEKLHSPKVQVFIMVPSGFTSEMLRQKVTEYLGMVSGFVFVNKQSAQEGRKILNTIPNENYFCMYVSQE